MTETRVIPDYLIHGALQNKDVCCHCNPSSFSKKLVRFNWKKVYYLLKQPSFEFKEELFFRSFSYR